VVSRQLRNNISVSPGTPKGRRIAACHPGTGHVGREEREVGRRIERARKAGQGNAITFP